MVILHPELEATCYIGWMPQPDVNRPFDLFGQFWLPDKPDEPTPGRLYRTEEGIRIQLFKDLRPKPSYVPIGTGLESSLFEEIESPAFNEPITLHGRIGDLVGKITAHRCRTVHSVADLLYSVGEYVLEPLYVVFGDHLAVEGQQSSGVRVRTTDMDEWANLAGMFTSRAEDGTRSLGCRLVESEAVSIDNGAVLKIHQVARMTAPSVKGGLITREVWLEVAGMPSATWVEIDRGIVTPLVSLLTLCVGEVVALTGIELTVDGEHWLPLAAKFIHHREPREERLEMLAPLADVKLTGVAAWLNKVEQLGPLPPVVARFSAHQASVRVETELLEMTTVAEGLHARLYPDERRLDVATCEDVCGRVLGALDEVGDQVKDIIRGMLEHLSDPGYTSRLKGLARRIEGVAPKICGKSNRWAEEVSKARNKYAHRSAGFLDESDVDVLLTVMESLRWLRPPDPEVFTRCARSRCGCVFGVLAVCVLI